MIGPWHVIFSTDSKGRSVTELRLPTSKPLVDDKGKAYAPDFVIICGNKTTVVYIDMKKPVGGEDDTIQLQYGSTGAFPARTEWKLSNDRVKVISPDPLNFVTEIKERASLDFQITPDESQPIGVFFSLDSIEQAFELMGERCYQ